MIGGGALFFLHGSGSLSNQSTEARWVSEGSRVGAILRWNIVYQILTSIPEQMAERLPEFEMVRGENRVVGELGVEVLPIGRPDGVLVPWACLLYTSDAADE